MKKQPTSGLKPAKKSKREQKPIHLTIPSLSKVFTTGSISIAAFKRAKFSKANLIIFVLLFGSIGAYAIFHSSAAGPNVWVSTTGNDSTCVRNDQTKPCVSFQKACSIAQGGDLISVAAGTYAPQVVTCAPSSNVTFQGASQASVIIQFGDSTASSFCTYSAADTGTNNGHGDTCGLNINGASNLTFQDMTISDQWAVHGGASNIVISNINAQRMKGGQFTNLSVTGGSYGPYEEGANGSGGSHFYPENSAGIGENGLTITAVTFHDYSCNSACITAGQHPPDCVSFAGQGSSATSAAGSILLERSQFYNCGGYDAWAKNTWDSGKFWFSSITFRNNFFGENYYHQSSGAQGDPFEVGFFSDNAAQAISNVHVLYNTIDAPNDGNSTGLAWCTSGCSFSNNTVIGNILPILYTITGCQTGFTTQYNVVIVKNSACDSTNTVSASAMSELTKAGYPNENLHLASLAAVAIDNGGAACSGLTDIDGDNRPQGAACDAGADEYVVSASVWVSTTGNDSTCVRGDQSKPCLSLNKAFSIAQCGDNVTVAAGSYTDQTISASKACTSSTQVKFVPATGAQPVFNNVNIQTSYVWIEGMKVPHSLNGTSVGNWNVAAPSPQLPSTVSYVTLKNDEGGAMYIYGEHVDVLGGSYGGFSACLTGQEDLTRIWQQSDSSSNYYASSYVTFDGVTIHDGTDNGNKCGDPVNGPHTDALQILGGHHITIRNSFFYGCPTSCIIGSGFRTGEDNYLIENNFFQQEAYPGATLNFGYVSNGDPPTGTNMVIRYNTTNGSIAAGCVAGSSGCWDVYGNILGHASYCGGFLSTWEYNVTADGSCVGGTNKTGTPNFIGPTPQSSYGSATIPNFHLAANDTVAVQVGDPSRYPSTDYDGDLRPQNSIPDAGADELVGAGSPDTTPPSVPTNLAKTGSTTSSISLSWSASSDNVGGTGLAGYRIYRNGSLVTSLGLTLTYTDPGLAAATSYSYQVSAYDNSNNESSKSTALNASTSSNPSPPSPNKPGDCNGDGHVTLTDLSILLSHYNTNYSSADFNGNGLVDLTDLSILLSHYGS